MKSTFVFFALLFSVFSHATINIHGSLNRVYSLGESGESEYLFDIPIPNDFMLNSVDMDKDWICHEYAPVRYNKEKLSGSVIQIWNFYGAKDLKYTYEMMREHYKTNETSVHKMNSKLGKSFGISVYELELVAEEDKKTGAYGTVRVHEIVFHKFIKTKDGVLMISFITYFKSFLDMRGIKKLEKEARHFIKKCKVIKRELKEK